MIQATQKILSHKVKSWSMKLVSASIWAFSPSFTVSRFCAFIFDAQDALLRWIVLLNKTNFICPTKRCAQVKAGFSRKFLNITRIPPPPPH